ncbi:MAG TPA: VWA domain-containing protein [Candidatus Dormibacteraeota bacterium]|nr:VWA domain-containing protein [Candidatus Dormibacteraeota bacterium]
MTETTPRGPWDPARVHGDRFLRNALLFSRTLRRAGLAADLPAVLDFTRALELIDIGDREEVKAAGASLFVRRREEVAPYGEIFDRFWRRHGFRETMAPEAPEVPTVEEEGPSEGEGRLGDREASAAEADEQPGEEVEGQVAIAPDAYSHDEALRHRDFDKMTAAELREAARLIDRIVPRLETRRTRRWELHPHGRIPAPRAMFRRNLGTGGELSTWLWRRPVRQPRSIVLICDISGSMERHARLLLRFGQALARSRVRTEAFVFGTRLTRVTRQLRGRDPDLALARVSATVTDWSGGTRIGASFREFNQRWARRALRTSGVVIVVSDGWDRGSAELVGEESARLRRNCHRLIWLNPLAGAPGYQPLAAGMAAAYPFIDDFLPAHDIASLERLGRLLARGGRRREVRSLHGSLAAQGRVVGPGRTGPGLPAWSGTAVGGEALG